MRLRKIQTTAEGKAIFTRQARLETSETLFELLFSKNEIKFVIESLSVEVKDQKGNILATQNKSTDKASCSVNFQATSFPVQNAFSSFNLENTIRYFIGSNVEITPHSENFSLPKIQGILVSYEPRLVTLYSPKKKEIFFHPLKNIKNIWPIDKQRLQEFQNTLATKRMQEDGKTNKVVIIVNVQDTSGVCEVSCSYSLPMASDKSIYHEADPKLSSLESKIIVLNGTGENWENISLCESKDSEEENTINILANHSTFLSIPVPPAKVTDFYGPYSHFVEVQNLSTSKIIPQGVLLLHKNHVIDPSFSLMPQGRKLLGTGGATRLEFKTDVTSENESTEHLWTLSHEKPSDYKPLSFEREPFVINTIRNTYSFTIQVTIKNTLNEEAHGIFSIYPPSFGSAPRCSGKRISLEVTSSPAEITHHLYNSTGNDSENNDYYVLVPENTTVTLTMVDTRVNTKRFTTPFDQMFISSAIERTKDLSVRKQLQLCKSNTSSREWFIGKDFSLHDDTEGSITQTDPILDFCGNPGCAFSFGLSIDSTFAKALGLIMPSSISTFAQSSGNNNFPFGVPRALGVFGGKWANSFGGNIDESTSHGGNQRENTVETKGSSIFGNVSHSGGKPMLSNPFGSPTASSFGGSCSSLGETSISSNPFGSPAASSFGASSFGGSRGSCNPFRHMDYTYGGNSVEPKGTAIVGNVSGCGEKSMPSNPFGSPTASCSSLGEKSISSKFECSSRICSVIGEELKGRFAFGSEKVQTVEEVLSENEEDSDLAKAKNIPLPESTG